MWPSDVAHEAQGDLTFSERAWTGVRLRRRLFKAWLYGIMVLGFATTFVGFEAGLTEEGFVGVKPGDIGALMLAGFVTPIPGLGAWWILGAEPPASA